MLSNVECIFLKPAQFGLEISNRMLNCSITDTEIENVVRNLPNNKAVGTDCITSILDFLAFVHRFSISQNFFGL
jgi:hypothetical protein